MFWKWILWQAQSYKPFQPDNDSYCSCHACIGHWLCEWNCDWYNTDGDCLGLK